MVDLMDDNDYNGNRNLTAVYNDAETRSRMSVTISPTLTNSSELLAEAAEMPERDHISEGLQHAVRQADFYYAPIIFALGIPCNTLAIILLCRRPLCKESVSVYLMAISTAESLFLCDSLYRWLADFTPFTLYHIGGWCQFITLVQHSSDFLVIWFMAAFSVNRYLTWCSPKYAARFCKVSPSRLIVISITIVSLVVYVNISLLFAHQTLGFGSKAYCMGLPLFRDAYINLTRGDVFINSFLPFCLIIIVFCLTARERYAKCMLQPCPQEATTEIPTADDAHVRAPPIALWLSLHVAYLLLMCPEEGLNMYYSTLGLSLPRYLQVKLYMWKKIFLLVKKTKYATNLFIFLASCPEFRESALNLAKAMCQCCRKRPTLAEFEETEPNMMHKESQTEN
ncbi:hypothetical protein CAPTEDRAFT_196014 [Capitella teleta]|uniref:G-protein coupled receptors family 1 profile domain-containing protein n=1 Tax=Capitella teleta TaxID=283909 RepID=R7VJF2_CAPTE|nr:hypothetical protein CAPTEDRAFT_196014 [Capitella teleta]|eukprot:ELU15905.1 hypothetical protein CAPTEDRAFT_196014 [Capitella teleta]